MPISEKYNNYAEKLAKELNILDIRTHIDDRNEKIGRKIRDNELKRIPYMLVIGEQEATNNQVAVREHKKGDIGVMNVQEFSDFVTNKVKEELDQIINQ